MMANDIKILIKLYAEKTPNYDEATDTNSLAFDVLKRSALILLVTAWESFVEDVLALVFKEKLDRANEPSDILPVFNAVVSSAFNDGKCQPKELVGWTGDGWKQKITERFDSDIDSLNTPNTENLRILFKRYLGIDPVLDWPSAETGEPSAATSLDSLIVKRGSLVHRYLPASETDKSVSVSELEKWIAVVQSIVSATERTLGTEPRIIGSPSERPATDLLVF